MAREKSGDVQLLGIVEVSRRLGVCTVTVKEYADEGLIPVVRDNVRRRLFFPADVAAFAQRRKAAKEAGQWRR